MIEAKQIGQMGRWSQGTEINYVLMLPAEEKTLHGFLELNQNYTFQNSIT